jgi:predicted DNA-binding protein
MNLLDYNDSVEGGNVLAFQLDEKTEKRILSLCKKTGMNKSTVIRILIRMALSTVETNTHIPSVIK